MLRKTSMRSLSHHCRRHHHHCSIPPHFALLMSTFVRMFRENLVCIQFPSSESKFFERTDYAIHMRFDFILFYDINDYIMFQKQNSSIGKFPQNRPINGKLGNIIAMRSCRLYVYQSKMLTWKPFNVAVYSIRGHFFKPNGMQNHFTWLWFCFALLCFVYGTK